MEIGLVLAGGGGKGSYQIGVWKALIELGIYKNITAISGTSIGALNTALFVNGDIDTAENVWHNISFDKILTFNGQNLMLGNKDLKIESKDLEYLIQKINSYDIFEKKSFLSWPNISKGIFSRQGLIDIIDENLNLCNISNSKILAVSVCTSMPWILPKYFILNNQSDKKIQSILLASSAFPIAFGFEKIDGNSYVDGGLTDNIPINILYIHGYSNIIVVHLNFQHNIDKSKYINSNIIEIKPSKDLGNIITGTFDFDKNNAIARIELGYNDTMNIKKQIEDKLLH